jgi:hypothetical protein
MDKQSLLQGVKKKALELDKNTRSAKTKAHLLISLCLESLWPWVSVSPCFHQLRQTSLSSCSLSLSLFVYFPGYFKFNLKSSEFFLDAFVLFLGFLDSFLSFYPPSFPFDSFRLGPVDRVWHWLITSVHRSIAWLLIESFCKCFFLHENQYSCILI